MHVTHLDDHASPPTAFSAPPFRHKEWRNLGLAARLAANPSNGIIQQAPSAAQQLSSETVQIRQCAISAPRPRSNIDPHPASQTFILAIR